MTSSSLADIYNSCVLCPHICKCDRVNGEKGVCNSSNNVKVASVNIHYGEEPPLVGENGSGAIFFSGCTLSCVFCQNYPISQLGNGKKYSVKDLSEAMISLQKRGACNINLVSPDHYIPSIIEALDHAKKNGLELPILYNCSGYERVEILKIIEPWIDIFLPDSKYSNNVLGERYSYVSDYVERNREVLLYLNEKKNYLKIEDGIAKKGMIIRHLVLPENIENSKEVLRFIAEELGTETYISIMNQYFPAYKANEYPELSEKVTIDEYEEVLDFAEWLGLENVFIQESD